MGMKSLILYVECLQMGNTGDGKLPSEETLVSYVVRELAHEKDLHGKKMYW